MGRERHRVFVKSGVTAETSEELLKRHFSTFGTVTDVYIPRSFPGPTPKGFAYISFESDDAVHEAVKEAVHEIEGKHYPVGRAEPRPAERTTWHQEDRKPVQISEPLLPFPPRYSRSVSPRGLLPNPYGVGLARLDMGSSLVPTPRMPIDAVPLAEVLPYPTRPFLPYTEGYGLEGSAAAPGGIPILPIERLSRSPRVFVGGLPDELVERHIRGHFQKFGTVEDVYFPRERHTGKRRGFCFVRFDTPRTAYFAAARSPRKIMGHEIGEIKVAKERAEDLVNDEFTEVGQDVDRFSFVPEMFRGPNMGYGEIGYGPDMGYGLERSRSYKIAPPYFELPREVPIELPRELAREPPRDFSREFPRAFASRLPIRFRPY